MENSRVELYYEPIEILDKLSCPQTEMSERDIGFLCGLIKKYRPEKIVEIGVAAGGTTAIILNCLFMLNVDAHVFSIDTEINYYRDKSKKVGYLGEECKGILRGMKHTLYAGNYSVECLSQIGKDIDFLILDTAHSLPGELLDFLACYPYLKQGCVVVLHDIALNHYGIVGSLKKQFATQLLLDVAVGEKILDVDSEFPNIGAFVVNEDTGKYIADLFSALTINWNYMPKEAELFLYRKFYNEYYSSENLRLFDMAVKLNKESLKKQNDMKFVGIKSIIALIDLMKLKNVYIYGCGKYGKRFWELLNACGIEPIGYIISDGQNKNEDNKPIYYLSEICIDNGRDIILIGVARYLHAEICTYLDERGINGYIIPDISVYGYLED